MHSQRAKVHPPQGLCDHRQQEAVDQKAVDQEAVDQEVCIDPFAPRRKPHYTYKMPSSSNSDNSDEDALAHAYDTLQLHASETEAEVVGKRYHEPEHAQKQRDSEAKRVRFDPSFVYSPPQQHHTEHAHKQQQQDAQRHRRSERKVRSVVKRHQDNGVVLPFGEKLIDEMQLCIDGLAGSLRLGRRHASSHSVYEWNYKVKRFLEANLEHAIKANNCFTEKRARR